MSAPAREPHLRAVPNPTSTASDGDALTTLLPDKTEVHVGLVRVESAHMFHRDVWRIKVQITQGPHQGAPLLWFLRKLEPKARPRFGSNLAASFIASTGRRPPPDLARRNPTAWLADCELLVATRVVRNDIHGVQRPAEVSYSLVSHVISRSAGAPPILRGGRSGKSA